MKVKRIVAGIIVLVICMGVFTGCEKSTTTDSKVTKLTMWTADSHSKLIMEKLVDELKKAGRYCSINRSGT